ncbi:ABC transporter permease [Ancylomarina sp.]|uniref:ABC transporter permease n=1 Tax=Ancylomarina sp. TaxID=1970196 RepID=UPI003568D7CA
MLLIIAWRNIWRNKLRSFVVIISVSLGLVGGIFSMAMMYGMINQRVQNIIENEISHIQVHHPKFTENYEMQYVIPNAAELQKKLMISSDVEAVCSRLRIPGMASSAQSGAGIMILGIQPDEERRVTRIHESLVEGSYLEGRRNPIIIGEKLARKLKVRLRSKIVLTFQPREGELARGAFRIVGIYKTNNSAFDQGQVFVKRSDLVRISEYQNDHINELALWLKDMDFAQTLSKQLQQNHQELQFLTWRKIQPDLAMVTDFMAEYFIIFMSIILVALGFAIVNTMLMVVMERIRELGMLMAIGMNRGRVFRMIILESVFLCLVGGIAGVGVSFVLIEYFNHAGIDLGLFAEGFESVGYASQVYPELESKFYFIIGFMVMGMGIGAAVYPAWKVLRYQPAKALRME